MKNNFTISFMLMLTLWCIETNAQSTSGSPSYSSLNYLGWSSAGGPLPFSIGGGPTAPLMLLTTTGYLGVGNTFTPATILDISPPALNLAYGIGGNCVLQNWGTQNIFTGVGAGFNLSGGTDNSFDGFQAGYKNSGASYNTLIGSGAGYTISTFAKNTFIGYQSGYYSSISTNNSDDYPEEPGNVAVGFQALFNNVGEVTQTAIGYKALYSYNRTPTMVNVLQPATNTACGYKALFLSQAYGGCAFGYEAGMYNVEGCSLIAIGEEAARANTQGNDNIAIGESALHSNKELSCNTVIGVDALETQNYAPGISCGVDTHGDPVYGCLNSYNVAVGFKALDQNNPTAYTGTTLTDGAFNSAVGSFAGYNNMNGISLSLLGYKADVCPTCTSLVNSTAIGANCLVNSSNKLILGGNSANGNNDVKVGIGLSNDNVYNGPRNKLEINADPAAMNFTGVGGSGLMFRQLNSTSTPGTNAAMGVLSVDPFGTVVLVNEVVGYGICATPVELPSNVGITFKDYKIYYKGQGNTGHHDDMNNAIGIGYICGDILPAKLSVDQTYTTSEDYATSAGYFHNGDVSHHISNSFTKTGIRSLADGEHTGSGIKNWNVGGDFYADNCDDKSIAVRGTAGLSSSVPLGLTFGGVFEGDNGSVSSYGITAGAKANGASFAYGIDAQGNGGTSANIGVKASTGGVSGATNYGLYAYAPIVACSTVTCIDAAGFFNGDVGSTGTGYYLVSDANLKDNIASLTNGMTIINQLNPKTYTFRTQQNPNISLPTGTQSGLLAQDVEPILPALVKNFKILPRTDSLGNIDTTGTGSSFEAISYMGIIPYLIAGMKEQQQTIDSMNQTMAAMQSQLDNCCSAGNRHANPGGDEGNSNGIDVELKNIRQIVLNQNFPNPFAEHTLITYIIPSDVKEAQIFFYDNKGTILKTVDITERGEGQINVYAPDLSSGIYKYTLITDGKVFDTKQMVKQN